MINDGTCALVAIIILSARTPHAALSHCLPVLMRVFTIRIAHYAQRVALEQMGLVIKPPDSYGISS